GAVSEAVAADLERHGPGERGPTAIQEPGVHLVDRVRPAPKRPHPQRCLDGAAGVGAHAETPRNLARERERTKAKAPFGRRPGRTNARGTAVDPLAGPTAEERDGAAVSIDHESVRARVRELDLDHVALEDVPRDRAREHPVQVAAQAVPRALGEEAGP